MKKTLLFIAILTCLALGSHSFYAQTVQGSGGTFGKVDHGIILAYPNPAKDFIMVKAKNPSLKIKSITFYSIIGVQVAEFYLNRNTSEIRLDRLKLGKYLVRYFLSDNTQGAISIIKQ